MIREACPRSVIGGALKAEASSFNPEPRERRSRRAVVSAPIRGLGEPGPAARADRGNFRAAQELGWGLRVQATRATAAPRSLLPAGLVGWGSSVRDGPPGRLPPPADDGRDGGPHEAPEVRWQALLLCRRSARRWIARLAR